MQSLHGLGSLPNRGIDIPHRQKNEAPSESKADRNQKWVKCVEDHPQKSKYVVHNECREKVIQLGKSES